MDDDFDLGGYVPSLNNSRSGSMKKLTRKADKSPAPVKTKQQNDFDDLDDLLNGDLKPAKKKDTSLDSKKPPMANKGKLNDTLDSFFDEPSSNLNTTTKIPEKKSQLSPSKMDFARTSINMEPKKGDGIIDEIDSFAPNFSKVSRDRSKSPTANQIKLPEDSLSLETGNVTSSMRNMKPPLRRRDSDSKNKPPNNTSIGAGLSLSLADQSSVVGGRANNSKEKGSTLTLNIVDEDEFSKPSRTADRRRSSLDRADKKYDNNETGLTLPGGDPFNKSSAAVTQFNIPDRKLDSPKRVRSPINQMKVGESILIHDKSSHFFNPSFKESHRDSFKQINVDNNNSSYSFENKSVVPSQSVSFQRQQENPSMMNSPPKLRNHIEASQSSKAMGFSQNVNQNSHQNYEKELQHIKQTYQKQIDYLQESLEKQMKVNQETRERLMKESNNMISEERVRTQRLHEEEIKRLKDMNEWEKKKIEDSYKFEVDNLKSALSELSKQQSSVQSAPSNSYSSQEASNTRYKREIDRLQEQLDNQKKLLIDRETFLTKRQLELEEREAQFSLKRRKEDDRIREQEKLLMDREMNAKNQILSEKKSLGEEKSMIAMEAANMEVDVIKRKEKLDLLMKEIEVEKNAINGERYEVRSMNQQLMARYKEKMEELGAERERVSALEADLVRKLRVIEIRAKESNINLNSGLGLNPQQEHHRSKENNWVQERPQSANEKQAKLSQTMKRYEKVEKSSANRTFVNQQLNKTSGTSAFRLEDYMVSMNKQSGKVRHNNFL